MTRREDEPQRIPHFGRFIGTGALLGALGGLLWGALADPAQGDHANQVLSSYGSTTILGFIAGAGALVGGLLAAVVAVLMGPKVTAPRRTSRRGRRPVQVADTGANAAAGTTGTTGTSEARDGGSTDGTR